ncbi:VIT1/CCC1 transporter family protein, partial [Pseudomonas aeruginosa]|nr:VIT1/CCC1 transporter family protein [Pseudomonas aeruginosa]
MPAETPPPRPDADPPQCALPEARPDRDAGTKLRAAVLGANDGLVSNLCLVMGVAGASMAHSSIVLTGMAGLVSGACSMALGEWLSVTNAREMASKRIAEEERLLRLCP